MSTNPDSTTAKTADIDSGDEAGRVASTTQTIATAIEGSTDIVATNALSAVEVKVRDISDLDEHEASLRIIAGEVEADDSLRIDTAGYEEEVKPHLKSLLAMLHMLRSGVAGIQISERYFNAGKLFVLLHDIGYRASWLDELEADEDEYEKGYALLGETLGVKDYEQKAKRVVTFMKSAKPQEDDTPYDTFIKRMKGKVIGHGVNGFVHQIKVLQQYGMTKEHATGWALIFASHHLGPPISTKVADGVLSSQISDDVREMLLIDNGDHNPNDTRRKMIIAASRLLGISQTSAARLALSFYAADRITAARHTEEVILNDDDTLTYVKGETLQKKIKLIVGNVSRDIMAIARKKLQLLKELRSLGKDSPGFADKFAEYNRMRKTGELETQFNRLTFVDLLTETNNGLRDEVNAAKDASEYMAEDHEDEDEIDADIVRDSQHAMLQLADQTLGKTKNIHNRCNALMNGYEGALIEGTFAKCDADIIILRQKIRDPEVALADRQATLYLLGVLTECSKPIADCRQVFNQIRTEEAALRAA